MRNQIKSFEITYDLIERKSVYMVKINVVYILKRTFIYLNLTNIDGIK